ncbi:VPLPA-CTERM protein sorting domain-containing protein [Poseidonocella pacifica]|uniref:VPLPA-CTERM protein sorting domain-containing protein n=1 Tax=Poseidonocella pacifica TaxID=871651 RepID=A0A1I0YPE1_9RHOB|nr:collagen-binding domain-containing protein [Poseidonocella pacifica]SFB14656.1 VPLPA-CTERM protein sorting domain-containing protein [Poseidonocella pacifica]
MKKIILAAITAVFPAVTQAASLSAVELLREFSLITTGDVTVNSLHVHGRALIGGGMTGNLAEINHANIDSIVPSLFDELILVNATASSVRVLNSGSASFTGVPTFMDAATSSSPAVPPLAFGTVMSTFSDTLGVVVATGAADKTTFSNRIILDTAAIGGVSVYDLVEADFTHRDVELKLNGADSIVVNVRATATDKEFALQSNFLGDKSISQNVIWNFLGFDSLRLERSIYGQVLAKGSDVFFSSDIEGSLFADTVTAQAQIHVQPLDFSETTPVPLPAGLPLLGAGIVAFGALRLRRKG